MARAAAGFTMQRFRAARVVALLISLSVAVGDSDATQLHCADGSLPKVRPGYVPSVNGCGPGKACTTYALALGKFCSDCAQDSDCADGGSCHMPTKIPDFDFVSCCNEHDKCYGTCNAGKDRCDAEFYQCMLAVCERDGTHGCDVVAGVYYNAVHKLGVPFFTASQKCACTCPGGEFKAAHDDTTTQVSTSSTMKHCSRYERCHAVDTGTKDASAPSCKSAPHWSTKLRDLLQLDGNATEHDWIDALHSYRDVLAVTADKTAPPTAGEPNSGYSSPMPPAAVGAVGGAIGLAMAGILVAAVLIFRRRRRLQAAQRALTADSDLGASEASPYASL